MNKLFIFDMGGVVVNNCSLWPDVARAVGVDDVDYRSVYGRLLQAAHRGDISSMENLRIMAARAGRPVPQENYWQKFFHPDMCPGTVQLIESLKSCGQRVVCGTNTIDVHYQYHIDHHEYDCFDAVYASNLLGQAKPDITFWHAIRNAEKYAFEDMFFFDDMIDNVAAAASLGIKAHQFTTSAEAADYIRAETNLAL